MWRFDPPYPSFAFVMSKVEAHDFDPSRLPAYRSSFLDRYHPYPRPSNASRHARRQLMKTVDYRHSPTPQPPFAPSANPVVQCQPLPDNDLYPAELDLPVVGVEYDEGEIPGLERLGRSKVAAAFSALLDALRLKYLTSNAVGNFLKPRESK